MIPVLISCANLKGHQNSAPACEDFKVNLNRAAVGEVSFPATGRVAVLLWQGAGPGEELH